MPQAVFEGVVKGTTQTNVQRFMLRLVNFQLAVVSEVFSCCKLLLLKF